ncbi:MAG: c-type cytochrome [bacterium]|uniref:C-type cytochrome n=1 Tax=Candidatus Methylomirabilis tolerans TaxID=3123416 RepID=A0AAJ1AHX2_9BACT|nr:c-type cytochrome [Candidatus Methylomirabilis sp.]
MARKAIVQVMLLTALIVSSAVGAEAAASANIEPKAPEKYMTFCAPCHGPTGKGDGLAAASLNPKPRNFADGTYMNARTDAQLTNVIKNGSAAEKLSPLMTGYSNMLNDKEIKDTIAFIRAVAVPKYQPKK